MKNTMINYSKNENIGITKCSELIPLSRIRDNGVINNVAPPNPVENMKDDNANGIPDEQEELGTAVSHEKSKPFHVSVAEKEEKTSLLKELRDCIPEPSERPHRALHPELVL
ncbi:MAG: hypothetical protein IJJ65_06145 [Butyrivibrio sp.]|nr:hypothetical protein [Butyrivibrio sp.]